MNMVPENGVSDNWLWSPSWEVEGSSPSFRTNFRDRLGNSEQAGSSLSALGTASVCSGVPAFAATRVTLDVTLAVGASASARWLKPKVGITLPR
jgi:hypothetical protein